MSRSSGQPHDVAAENKRLGQLFDLVCLLARSDMELAQRLRDCVKTLAKLTRAEKCSLMLIEEGRLCVKAATVNGVVGLNIPLEQMAVSTEVVRTGKAVFLEDITQSPLAPVARSAQGSDYRTGSFISLPLRDEGVVVGVLNLSDKIGSPHFDAKDLEMAEALADQISGLVNFSALHDRLELAYQDLNKAQRARQDLLNMVFHEVSAPLEEIRDTLGRLARGDGPGAEPARELRRAEAEVEVVRHKLGNLLDLSRMESGLVDLAPGRVDLAQLAAKVAGRLAPLAEAHGVSLALRAEARPVAAVDGDLCERIMANLFINAVNFSAPAAGGSVEVAVRIYQDEQYGLVEVIDAGSGQDRGQGRGALESPGPGGSGLFFCRRAAWLLGGEVVFRHTPEGGAGFLLSLPLAPDA